MLALGMAKITWIGDELYYNGHVAVGDGALTEIDQHTYEKLAGHYSLPDMSEAVR